MCLIIEKTRDADNGVLPTRNKREISVLNSVGQNGDGASGDINKNRKIITNNDKDV
jgi:hypothetical protein